MTLASLTARLRKIEAARLAPDRAIRDLSDAELADAMREVSDDPRDHAFADWFEAGCAGPLPDGVLETIQRSL